jgi:hypothetical protein
VDSYPGFTYAVTERNDLSIGVDTDINVSITDFETVDELSDVDMGDLRPLVGIGLRGISKGSNRTG